MRTRAVEVWKYKNRLTAAKTAMHGTKRLLTFTQKVVSTLLSSCPKSVSGLYHDSERCKEIIQVRGVEHHILIKQCCPT